MKDYIADIEVVNVQIFDKEPYRVYCKYGNFQLHEIEELLNEKQLKRFRDGKYDFFVLKSIIEKCVSSSVQLSASKEQFTDDELLQLYHVTSFYVDKLQSTDILYIELRNKIAELIRGLK